MTGEPAPTTEYPTYVPQYAPPPQQYPAPPQNVVYVDQNFQPGPYQTNGYTVGVNQEDSALVVQIFILVAGWFCCCIWAAGFAYTKHPNPNVALMAKINAALFLLGIVLLCCSMVGMVVYFIVLFAIVGASY